MVVLERLHREHEFPLLLFSKIKKNLKFNYTQDLRSVNTFVEELPHNLKTELSIYIYEKVYMQVDFLRTKSKSFISWICPMLKMSVVTPKEYVVYEGDEIQKIFFLRSGQCHYVLPKYQNSKYITIN